MTIKKLTKPEIEEGLTLESVNRINLKQRHSPVLFTKESPPVTLVPCSTEYWVTYEKNGQQWLRDEKNNRVVKDERSCQVARARYLLYHEKEEQEADVKELLKERKTKARNALDKIKGYILSLENRAGSDFGLILAEAIGKESKSQYLQKRQEEINRLPKIKRDYEILETLYKNDKIIDILELLKIEQVRENPGTPMISVSFDDEKSMNVIKEIFGATALNADDFTMDKVYAQINVAKERKLL